MRCPVFLVPVLVVLASCVNMIEPKEVNRNRFETWTDELPDYRLQAGDELEVRLIYSPEFSDRVQVAPDGMIRLTLVGAVRASGRTPEELGHDIESRYARELRHPNVVVVPRAFASQQIYVGGEVQKPGLVPLAPQMGVLQGVIAAGGLTTTADANTVVLLRRTKRDTPMLRVVRLKEVIEGTNLAEDVQLSRFDIIFVPRSGIAELDLWVDQHINQLIPRQSGFSYSLSATVR